MVNQRSTNPSPSDKLKALKDEGTPESMAVYHDVHAQIVEVVAAAKTVNDDLFFDPVLDAALAALEKALNSGV